ncbi:unnamed protein product [Musa hybrid cultivar]
MGREHEVRVNRTTVADEASLTGAVKDLEAGESWPSRGGPDAAPVNRLSSREKDSLAAVCDAFLPSIHVPHAPHQSLRTYYANSASMIGTPEVVGGYLSERLQHPRLWQLRLALWLLSTWFGTFILCGTNSLSCRFPFFRSFPEVEAARREDIIRSWSMSCIFLLRVLYKGFKALVVLFYFTQLNEKNENPAWEAIGYVGPDPKRAIKSSSEEEEEEEEGARYGPLYKALVHMAGPKDVLCTSLSRAGLSLVTSQSQPDGLKSKPLPTIYCDAVVVGSGSGGGVVAGVLAKAGFKVVVLEKGGYHARTNLTLLERHTLDHMYEGCGVLTTEDLGVFVLSGSTVGGGSAVNWSASIRTPDHVISEWRHEHGLELFDSDVYAEALDAVSGRMGVQCEVRHESLANAVLRRGCDELGYPVQTVGQNAPPDHDCGWCCFGCRDGSKKGTSETWLVDMAESGNGVIIPGSRALRVLHADAGRNKNVAAGVVFEFRDGWRGKKERCIIRSKVTVVACGALNTPVLLKKSGLRNANIGRHLHLHPVVMSWGYFPESDSRWQPSKENQEKITSYEGAILTTMSTVVSNFATSGYGAVIQTPALHPGLFSVATPWLSGADYKDRMARFSRTAHIFALARDRGSGTVDASGCIRYRMGAADEKNLQRGLEKILRIMAAAGAEEIGTQHCHGDRLNVRSASSHQFERFVKATSGKDLMDLSTPVYSAHQMGSCRMGIHPRTSAVNSRGETWEVEGLFVADASVLPTALGVNPMVTVQAFAYCTAHSVLEELRRRTKRENNHKN